MHCARIEAAHTHTAQEALIFYYTLQLVVIVFSKKKIRPSPLQINSSASLLFARHFSNHPSDNPFSRHSTLNLLSIRCSMHAEDGCLLYTLGHARSTHARTSACVRVCLHLSCICCLLKILDLFDQVRFLVCELLILSSTFVKLFQKANKLFLVPKQDVHDWL